MGTRSLIIGSLVMTLIVSLGLGCAQTPVGEHGGVTIIGPAVDIFAGGERPGIEWNGTVWYFDSDPERFFVNSDGDLEWANLRGDDAFKTSIPKQRLSEVGDIAEMTYMFMSDGPHGCGEGRNKKCLVSDDDDCYENDITCIAGTSDIRVGFYEAVPDPDEDDDRDYRGYNFRFGPNMMAGPTRWIDYKGEVHKTGMFAKVTVRSGGQSKNSGLMGKIPGFELEPGEYSYFNVRLERISEDSIRLSITLNDRTIRYTDDSGDDLPQSINVFVVSMRNGRPYTRVVFRAL